MAEKEPKLKDSVSEKDVKAPNILERAKEEIEAVFHHDKSPRHHKETHGRNDDIDEGTSVEEVKAPGVFERVKEELEAVVEAIHPKKASDTKDSPSNKECQPFTYVRIEDEFGKITVCYSDFDKNYTLGYQQNRRATMI